MGTDSADLDAARRAAGLRTVRALLPEAPSHEVTVADFLIDTVLVTNRDFAAFVAARPDWSPDRADPALHNGRYLEHWPNGEPPPALATHPVTFVTWQSAEAYCVWRGKRLPTEPEFEWAAQDGVTRGQFPWGNEPPHDSLVSWGFDGINTTVPVASYPPNPRGLYDMAGNVWQFTSDPWRGSYGEMLVDTRDPDSLAADPRIRRVVRGGSWGASAANLRVRYRDSHRPFDAREMVGFRCVRDAA